MTSRLQSGLPLKGATDTRGPVTSRVQSGLPLKGATDIMGSVTSRISSRMPLKGATDIGPSRHDYKQGSHLKGPLIQARHITITKRSAT